MDDVSIPDRRIAGILAQLPASGLIQHQDEVFDGQSVRLDGRRFVNCTFRRCVLYITLGWFQFAGNQNFVECSWGLEGPAKGTVQLLDSVRDPNAGPWSGPAH